MTGLAVDASVNAPWPDGMVARRGDVIRVTVDRLAADGLLFARGYLEFVVEELVGRGGQALVYRARLTEGGRQDDREYALKLFSHYGAARREWNALRLHSNERIVPQCYVLGFVEGARGAWGVDDGVPVVVMEYVSGTVLSDVMADSRHRQKMTLEDALRIIGPIVRFASNAMQARTPDAHRDIKPSNIVIDDDGDVRLLDFGISARSRQEAGIQGTYGFASPEQRGRIDDPGETSGDSARERLIRCAPAIEHTVVVTTTDDTPFVDDVDGEDVWAVGEDEWHDGGDGDLDDATEPTDSLGLDAIVRQDTYNIAATLYAMIHDGNPPVYGYAEKAPVSAAVSPLRHDPQLVSKMCDRVSAELRGAFGFVLLADQVEGAVADALGFMDALVDGVLRSALSTDAMKRPSPAELEALLPLRPQEYEWHLFTNAMLSHLRAKAEEASDGEDGLPVEAPAAHEFVDALNYFNRGLYEQAVPIFAAHARRGNISAMYYLGICYRDGLGGLERDSTQVALLFSQAAEHGNIMAQNAFGVMLYNGDGVPRNRQKGVEWIRKAAADDPISGRRGSDLAKHWLEGHAAELEG